MRVVKVSEIVSALEPAAFEGLDGKTYKGGIVSHLQYRKILELLPTLDAGSKSEQVEAGIRGILGLLGFAADGITAGLALPTEAFFAVVDDFFEKYRGEKKATAAGPSPVDPPTAN